MNRRATLTFVALSVAATAAVWTTVPGVARGADDANACAQAVPVVRPRGGGYQHVVQLTNACPKPVSCEVWTDVDPQPHHQLIVKPGETAEVIVRNGSPARELKADRACSY